MFMLVTPSFQILLNQSHELLQAELWDLVVALSPSKAQLFSKTLVQFLSSVPWLSPTQAAAIATSAGSSLSGPVSPQMLKTCLQRTLDDVRCIKPSASAVPEAVMDLRSLAAGS